MAQQLINVGTTANDNTGDTLRAAFIKTNDNFNEVYGALSFSSTHVTLAGELRGPANLIIDPSAIGDNTGTVTIKGNLQVDGTTTTINSTITTLDDPIITLGGDTAPTSDDAKDRGIEFRWYDTQARVGFFGFDRSTGKFTFIPNATNTSEVFAGTAGIVVADLEGKINSVTISGTGSPTLNVGTGGTLGTAAYTASTSYVSNSGASIVAGQFNTTTTNPTNTNRINYEGYLYATRFYGDGSNLTSLPAGNLSGTIPSGVLGASSIFIGTTSVALNRASANLALTGISSVTLPGATSGTILLQPTATAGTTTITLPATTGTVITTGDTGTVTNTMLAGSIATSKITGLAASATTDTTNASNITSGTLSGDRGVAAGSTSVSFIEYNGTTKTSGMFDGGTTAPTNTTRLNYDGYLYATRFYGDGSQLTGISLPSGQTAGSTTAGYLQYSGTTVTAGQMNGSLTAPTATTRLNYEGYLYATRFYGDGSQLTGVSGSGATITDDTTTNAVRYLLFDDVITGAATTIGTSSTKLTFNPSTGLLTLGGGVKISTNADIVTATATTTSTTATALATFASATYGSAKVVIQATQGVNRQVTEMLVVHDGTIAYANEYGTQFTGSRLFNVEVDISAGNVRVLVSTILTTSTVYKTQYTLITA